MNEPINIQARPVEVRAAGLDLADLQYIFFRHKWKILLFFLAGVAVAAALYFLRPPMYQSEAKILIRYVLETVPTPSQSSDTTMKSPDSRGENIINSELEIISSLDLAAQVAEAVGPEKILAAIGGGTNKTSAASVIRGGLSV